jgi:hypothetical protein
VGRQARLAHAGKPSLEKPRAVSPSWAADLPCWLLQLFPSALRSGQPHIVPRVTTPIKRFGREPNKPIYFISTEDIHETHGAVLPPVPYLDTLRWPFIGVALGGLEWRLPAAGALEARQ